MSDHEHTKHYGKALVVIDQDANTVELIMECVSCGKFSIKVPMVHMRSSLKMLEQVADRLGLPAETAITEVQGTTAAESPEELESITREFDRMEVEPPWVRKTETQPSDGNWD